jgi:hypothetical protein
MNAYLVSVSNRTKDDVSILHRPSIDNALGAINKYRPYIFATRDIYNPSTKVCIAEINITTNLIMNSKYFDFSD